jgi:hypothetical protein
MIIKILKACATPFGSFNVSEVVDIPSDTAQAWIKSGIAETSKGKVETATLDLPTEKTVVNSVTDKDEMKRQQTNDRVKRYRERQALQENKRSVT